MKKYKVTFLGFILSLSILLFLAITNSWDLFSLFIVIVFIYELYTMSKNYIKNKDVVMVGDKKNKLLAYWDFFISLFFS